MTVIEASSTAPSIAAVIVIDSKAYFSAHIIIVAGIEIERYSPQPRSASTSNGTIASEML